MNTQRLEEMIHVGVEVVRSTKIAMVKTSNIKDYINFDKTKIMLKSVLTSIWQHKILNMDVKSFMNTVISLIIMCIYIKQEKHIDKY